MSLLRFRTWSFDAKFTICGVFILMVISLSAADAVDTVDCDIQNGSCTKTVNGIEVTLDIQPKPVKAMHDLRFRVTFRGGAPKTDPHIDLGMPRMKMGPNRVDLKPAGAGVYEGTGVIVRCPSGRRVWWAKVTIPEIGETTYTFDVIY